MHINKMAGLCVADMLRPAFVSRCPNDPDYSFRDGLLGFGFYLNRTDKNRDVYSPQKVDLFQPVYNVVSDVVLSLRGWELPLRDDENATDVKMKIHDQVEIKLTHQDFADTSYMSSRTEMLQPIMDELELKKHVKSFDLFDKSAFKCEYLKLLTQFKSDLSEESQQLLFPKKWKTSEQLYKVHDNQRQIQELFSKVLSNKSDEVSESGEDSSIDGGAMSENEFSFNLYGMEISSALHDHMQLLSSKFKLFQHDTSGEELKRNEEARLRLTHAEELLEEKAQNLVIRAKEQNGRIKQQIAAYEEKAKLCQEIETNYMRQKELEDAKSEELRSSYEKQIKELLNNYADEVKRSEERNLKARELMFETQVAESLREEKKDYFEKVIKENESFINNLHTDTQKDTLTERLAKKAEMHYKKQLQKHETEWVKVITDTLYNTRYVENETKLTEKAFSHLYEYLLAHKRGTLSDCKRALKKTLRKLGILSAGRSEQYKDVKKEAQEFTKSAKALKTDTLTLMTYKSAINVITTQIEAMRFNNRDTRIETALKLKDFITPKTDRSDLTTFTQMSPDYLIPALDSSVDVHWETFQSGIPTNLRLSSAHLNQSWTEVSDDNFLNADTASLVTLESIDESLYD